MNKKTPRLEYSRRVFADVQEWYKNADSKAQIILTIDGAFLAFLTNSIFMEQDKLLKVVSQFGIETWLLLILMSSALTGSILSSIFCLWSRIDSDHQLDEDLKSKGVEIENSETYSPQFMFFFQFISRLDPKKMAERLATVDEIYEIEALAHESQILSKNVLRKHKWVNRGFALAGSSLILFLGAGISYVLRVSG